MHRAVYSTESALIRAAIHAPALGRGRNEKFRGALMRAGAGIAHSIQGARERSFQRSTRYDNGAATAQE